MKGDVKRIQKYYKTLLPKEITKSTVQALNRTIAKVKKEKAPELQEKYGGTGITSAGLRKLLKVKKARFIDLSAAIIADTRRGGTPLINFGARKAARGVRHKAYGRRQIAKGAFIATMPGGHKGVYRRTSKGRLPIKELYGPALSKVLADKDIQQSFRRSAFTHFPIELEKAFKKV